MTDRIPLSELENASSYADRHLGMSEEDTAKALAHVGYRSLTDLTDAAVPAAIRDHDELNLPTAASEASVLAELTALASRNRPMAQMIGLGYHDTLTPPVISRNVLENSAWYTAYTPYQPEISQGRLEALMNFQLLVAELSGLPVANASLLDEATAAAEAMALAHRVSRAGRGRFLVDSDCLPQTIAVVRTRAAALGIDIVLFDPAAGLPDTDLFGVLLQYPGASGAVRDHTALITEAHGRGALVTVAADPLALVALRSPGSLGADVVVGSAQRFGCPLGFGGPHAGFMAVGTALRRQLPGRLVAPSVDAHGTTVYQLGLQAREQHIRREKATSNVCTAAVLTAVVAGLYAVYHGPQGLRTMAERVHRYAVLLAAGLEAGGVRTVHGSFFDTVLAATPRRAALIITAARERGVNLRLVDDDHVAICCDEVTERQHLQAIWEAFEVAVPDMDALDAEVPDVLPPQLRRATDGFLPQEVFHRYRSETTMLRYIRSLADRDYALDRGMIPLGSCTMKSTPAAAMQAVTWPGFAGIHPFAPLEQAEGYLELIRQLECWLAEITGYDAVSLQPNSGAQGEYAGLLAVRGYQATVGEGHRDVCLMPASAHGTNAASAAMAGLRVVVVACDSTGAIDLDDLHRKLNQYRHRFSVIMITYPSTHGVFEESIADVCRLAHDAGGQVYLDGANLNGLVGLARPGRIGADVSHVNLHKTFGSPHGGGGPGVGPVCVKRHLAPHLPGHPVVPGAGPRSDGPVSAAPWGSAGILPISWAYIRLMGPTGLLHATQKAILAANYVARRLEGHYPVLYKGPNGLVAHECIIDIRPITKATGITATDIAKRLADYGFHAPTLSFPVPGTLMIEPTESESLAEIDRLCAALTAIKRETDAVANGIWDAADSPLRNAPHTAAALAAQWNRPYSREEAVFPLPSTRSAKYWPVVGRIDQAHGDRNFTCTCPSIRDNSKLAL